MKKFVNIVEEQSSSLETDDNKFLKYLSKFPIWDFSKISKENFQLFPMEQKIH